VEPEKKRSKEKKAVPLGRVELAAVVD